MTKQHDKSDSEFAQMVGEVRRLDSDKVDLHQQKPRVAGIKSSRNRLDDEHLKPDFTQRRMDQTTEQWFDHGLNAKLRRRIKNGQITLDASVDLHGYHQNNARKELLSFLAEAKNRQCHFVLVIHGKGFRSESEAVLRPMVQDILLQHPDVLAFCPAQPPDGGSGATYIYLRKN